MFSYSQLFWKAVKKLEVPKKEAAKIFLLVHRPVDIAEKQHSDMANI